MKKVILIVIILAIAIGGWYAYSEYNRTNVDLQDKKAEFTLNATELISSFEKDSATANKQYVDKIIEVSGRVKKIDAEGNPVVISLGQEGVMSTVQCSMDSTHANDYKIVKKGTMVTIKGMLNGAISDEMFGTDVKLNRCVIQTKD